MSKGGTTGAGILLGALVGYPISYFFQPSIVRAKLSIGDYIQHIGDVLQTKELSTTAIGTWVGCIVVFGLLGMVLGSASGNKS